MKTAQAIVIATIVSGLELRLSAADDVRIAKSTDVYGVIAASYGAKASEELP